ncbi:metallophosphoesterase, partial [Vibrio splendidus]
MNNLRTTTLKNIDANDYENIYIATDIHGEIGILKSALKEVGFNNKDLLIIAGDLIDRGSDSIEAIEFVLESDNVEANLGNHEALAILCLVHGIENERETWMMSGGDWIHNYEDEIPRLKALFERVENEFPLCFELKFLDKKVLIAHAAIPGYSYDTMIADRNPAANKLWLLSKHEDLEEQDHIIRNQEDYLDDLDLLDVKPVSGADLTIHGHTSTLKPMMINNRLYIDTRVAKDAGM